MSSLEAASSPRIVCPHCGHGQEDPIECHGCGVIFARLTGRCDNQTAVSLGTKPERAGRVIEWKKLGLLFLLIVVLWLAVQETLRSVEIRHPPGILAPAEPLQVAIRNGRPWERPDRTIFPLAEFQLTARVLSRERYRFDAQSDLSPIDLALGWGVMSDQRMIDQLEIAQSSRFYVVAPRGCSGGIPWSLVMRSSANMHMIPSDEEVRRRLLNLRPGSIIRFAGFLVGVQTGGRWVWVSSLSRTDTGDGACEIVWVKELSVL